MIGRLLPLDGAPSVHPEADSLLPEAEPEADPERSRVPLNAPLVGEAEIAALVETVKSGFVSSAGPAVRAFESALARRCDTAHALSVTSGTHALDLVLHAFDLVPGDEVIVPALTFISVGACVARAGARPVFVDVDRSTLNLTPEAVAAAIGPRTRGIVAVHTYGHPAPMDALKALADRHGLFLLEDACEALGATLGDRPVGGLGDVAVHSFYANKVITTGNGGAITTSHPDLHALLARLRGYSYDGGRFFWHRHMPFNVRMSALQAAVGRVQLDRLDGFLEGRRRVAAFYDTALADVPGILRPTDATVGRHARWTYVVHVDPEAYGEPAIALRRRLAAEGVETRAVFTPLHVQPVLQSAAAPAQGPFPNAGWAARSGVGLPSGPTLDEEALARVVRGVRRV